MYAGQLNYFIPNSKSYYTWKFTVIHNKLLYLHLCILSFVHLFIQRGREIGLGAGDLKMEQGKISGLVLWWVINKEKANNFNMLNFDIFDNLKIEIWTGFPEYLWTAENWGYARQSFLDFIIMLIIKGPQSAFLSV